LRAALNLATTSQAIIDTAHVNYYPVCNGSRILDPIARTQTTFTGFLLDSESVKVVFVFM